MSGAWKWPMNSRKAHYFLDDEIRSLCLGWAYTGPATQSQGSPADKPGPDDCAKCWRLMRKRETRESGGGA